MIANLIQFKKEKNGTHEAKARFLKALQTNVLES